ncbi:aquaporin, partial [Agrocybe pediades]
RSWFWEYAGEFFGVMMLVMFGSAANCQYNLSSDTRISPSPAGTWASLSLGWATGISLGVLLTGGHINPAVTLAMAVWRGFPWRKVPFYILAQLLGGIVGAAIVYGNYLDAIDIYEGGRHIRTLKTAGFFGTVPLDYLSNMTCFWDEFIGTALLLFGLLALLDKRNGLSPGLVAIGFFFVFVGIAACFGMQTGFAVNPARDLGPRIFTSMVGYGVQVYNLRKQYWLWSPVFATIMGAQFGTMMFDVFLDTGDQSIVTKLWVFMDICSRWSVIDFFYLTACKRPTMDATAVDRSSIKLSRLWPKPFEQNEFCETILCPSSRFNLS